MSRQTKLFLRRWSRLSVPRNASRRTREAREYWENVESIRDSCLRLLEQANSRETALPLI
jgi:hypothetical protein